MRIPPDLLDSSNKDCILLHETDDRSLDDEWAAAGLIIKTLNGSKMRTDQGFFDEIADALQFPDYFGDNWAAVDECVSDMDWMDLGTGIVIVILDPDAVLIDDHHYAIDIASRIFRDAGDAYSRPITSGESWDRPAVPFHVLLRSSPRQSPQTIARWRTRDAVIRKLI